MSKNTRPRIQTSAPRVHIHGDETIKIALIGCGGRGTGAACQALSTEGPVKLWAMADIFQERIDSSLLGLQQGLESRYDREENTGFADKVDVPPERQFVGFDAYKRAIDSGVDLAILTTFPHFRPEQYEYAVRQSVNVFQEKPLAVDAPGVRRLLAADFIAKEKGLKVGVGLQRRHNPVYQEVMARIHDGAIGRPQLIQCYWNGSTNSALAPREEGMSEMEYQLRNRYMFTWLCGDHNVEQHIHNIDVCNWIMEDYPVKANGMGGRQYRNGREHGEIFDHHYVEYEYADETIMYSQCRQMPNCWNRVAETVHGLEGVAELGQRLSTIQNAEGEWKTARVVANPYQIEHDDLFAAIRNNTPYNETDYGARSTMTAIMGRMATYSGKVVTLDEAMNSDLTLAPETYAMDATPPIVPDENGEYRCAMPGTTKGL
jgi:myo-inositol 2-dehydrogenase / D-chiro-inositol 1-dehydrogenase